MRLAGVVAATLLLAQAAGAEEIEKRAQADPRGEVVIANVAGDVQVIGWDRNEVQVKADLADDRQRLEFKTSGARTSIEVVLPKGGSYHGSTDLVINVPRNSSVETKTVSADQTIKDVRGRFSARNKVQNTEPERFRLLERRRKMLRLVSM